MKDNKTKPVVITGGDACKRQHYTVGSRKIFGYGCPMY